MPVAASQMTVCSVLSDEPLDADLAVEAKRMAGAAETERTTLAARMPSLGSMPDGDIRLALAHWALGRDAEAGKAAASSEHALAAWLRGELARSAGREEEALGHFRKAAQLAPTTASCALAPVESLIRLGQYGEALALVEKNRRVFSDKARLAFLEGRARDRLGDHEAALACYQEAMRVDPAYAPAIFHAAYLLDLRGYDAEAKKLYARIGPDQSSLYANACLNLGLLHDDSGDFQEAIGCFRHVLLADPLHPRARLYLKDSEASLTMHYSPEETKQSERLDAVLRIPVSDFELSVRSRNCLTTMSIQTLGDLAKKTESEMLAYKNFGETSLREIKEMLASKGLRLGMMREDAATRAAMERQRKNANQEIMAKPLDELNLGVRARRCCGLLGLATIGDLISRSENELAGARNFGRVSLNEIKKKLAEIGLALREPQPGEEMPDPAADLDDDDYLAGRTEEYGAEDDRDKNAGKEDEEGFDGLL